MAGANDDLAARIRAWAKTNCPGQGRVRIEVELLDGAVNDLVVRWLPAPATAARIGEAGPADPLADFVPTEAQAVVLEALEGVALKGSDLEEACGLEHSQMFRVLRQLQGLTPPLVRRHPSLGYYRLDAPPPQLATAGGEA